MINVRDTNLPAEVIRLIESLQQRVSMLEQRGGGASRANASPTFPTAPSAPNKPVVTVQAAPDTIATGGVYTSSDQLASTAPSAITSVNGLSGTVVLTTSNIAEGTNKYFTAIRARNAALMRTQSTASPTTTDLPTDGDASIHIDTALGKVYIAYNYGGTIVKTQLL